MAAAKAVARDAIDDIMSRFRHTGLVVWLSLLTVVITSCSSPVTIHFETENLKRRAEGGERWAQNEIGAYYSWGYGVPQDKEQAFYWFEKAADNDFSLGQFNLFLCYIKGEGTQKDLNKAIHYLQRSANQGYWRAELFLGLLLFEGVGVVADREKAVYWLEKAANQGATDAMYLLGTLYLDGEPDEREYSKALYWIRQAAYYGMPEAQYHYGCLFKEGVLVEPDMDKYFRWINRADHNGYYYARYGEYYAGRYLLALTQSREPVSDKTYLLQALEEQDINSEGKALYQEGFNSMFGPTLGKNNPGAIKCLIRSTLKGNQSAKILLAYCFATATGTLLESATAAQLFVGKGRIKYKDESGYTTIDFEIFEDGSCNKSMDWHRD